MPEDKKPATPATTKPEEVAAVTTATAAPTPTDGSKPKTNGMAIAAIICAILIPLVGLILGIVALAQINKTKEGGKGLAIASIIISSLIMLMGVFIFFAVIAAVQKAAKDSGVNYNASTGSISATDKEGNSTSFGNSVSLPSGFPSDVPIYKPSTTRLAVKTKDGEYNVTFTSKDTAQQIDNYYKSELAKQGWTNAEGGEVSFGAGKAVTFSKGDRRLVYVISADQNQYGNDEKTAVSLTVTNATD